MRQLLREPLLAAGASFAIVPPALLHFFSREQVLWGGWAHFSVVAATAGAATAAAIALTVVGARRRDARVVGLGTAFSVMAALLVVHGVATPGILAEMNGVVAFSGAATLPVGGALLVLCTLPALRKPTAVRPLLWIQAGLLLAITMAGAAGMLLPGLVPAVPEANSTAALVTLFAGLLLYGLVWYRALNTYLLTRRASDLAVVVGVVWLAAALVAALTLTYTDLGWWLGHILEVIGIAVVGAPVALDLRRAAQSRPLLGDLSAADLVAAEEAYLGTQVRALMVRLAEKDAYTEEHTRRVALRAVQIGEELGLSPARLRVLALGGLLHDMGKLAVPSSILGKPAALSDDEYDVIKRHPEWGERLLSELGFGGEVRRLVLDHHERVDGSGYPRGIDNGRLDLETRILAVSDVYDALISPRVYRAAWPHPTALALLRERAGVEFEARVVNALERVLARESTRSESRLAAVSVAV
jgi:HD-GYP domain-containing protein (c-di-GMP phosphodiesterase class II)